MSKSKTFQYKLINWLALCVRIDGVVGTKVVGHERDIE